MPLPKYVFRGTTVNYPGGMIALKTGNTFTSGHPAKATLFALECFQHFPNDAVIYVCETKEMMHYNRTENALAIQEDEIIFEMPPLNFYRYCLGYVHVRQMQKVLAEMGHPVYEIARYENLTRLCEERSAISSAEIEKLVKTLEALIQK